MLNEDKKYVKMFMKSEFRTLLYKPVSVIDQFIKDVEDYTKRLGVPSIVKYKVMRDINNLEEYHFKIDDGKTPWIVCINVRDNGKNPFNFKLY